MFGGWFTYSALTNHHVWTTRYLVAVSWRKPSNSCLVHIPLPLDHHLGPFEPPNVQRFPLYNGPRIVVHQDGIHLVVLMTIRMAQNQQIFDTLAISVEIHSIQLINWQSLVFVCSETPNLFHFLNNTCICINVCIPLCCDVYVNMRMYTNLCNSCRFVDLIPKHAKSYAQQTSHLWDISRIPTRVRQSQTF